MNLNKDNVLRIISQLPFPRNSFWVIMGGALVLHGVRDVTNDIDIGCNNTLFEQLQSCGHVVSISRSGKERIDYTDLVHIYREWVVDSIDLIDNVQVASLKSIIKDKQLLGRTKDIQDIELIQQFLKGVDS